MRATQSLYMLFLIPALALAACGGEKPIDGTTGAVEEAMPSGGYHLAGTYTASSQTIGDFSQLVLKKDGTYHARQIVACMRNPCRDAELDGHFTLLRRETLAYFEIFDAGGASKGRYQYMLQGDTLNVRKLGSTDTFKSMTRSPAAWCAVTQDCALQDLQPGPCAGQYFCTDAAVCNWQCGAAPEIAGQIRKTGAGG